MIHSIIVDCVVNVERDLMKIEFRVGNGHRPSGVEFLASRQERDSRMRRAEKFLPKQHSISAWEGFLHSQKNKNASREMLCTVVGGDDALKWFDIERSDQTSETLWDTPEPHWIHERKNVMIKIAWFLHEQWTSGIWKIIVGRQIRFHINNNNKHGKNELLHSTIFACASLLVAKYFQRTLLLLLLLPMRNQINIQLMSLDEQQHQNLHDFFLLLVVGPESCWCRVEFRSAVCVVCAMKLGLFRDWGCLEWCFFFFLFFINI